MNPFLRALPFGWNSRRIDAQRWTLKVGGEGTGKQLELSLPDLQSNFEAVDIAARLRNAPARRRGFPSRMLTSVEWGLGAVGNALWKSARLKDVLSNRAKLQPRRYRDHRQLARMGPVLDGTPISSRAFRLAKGSTTMR